jgi:Na+/melibiose symporter-like transporter
MAKGKDSMMMTFIIAALTIGFVMYALYQWFDPSEQVMMFSLLAIGGVIVYFAIAISNLEKFINKGLIWGGGLLVLLAPYYGWGNIPENIRPVVLGAILVGVILFGMKFRKELI